MGCRSIGVCHKDTKAGIASDGRSLIILLTWFPAMHRQKAAIVTLSMRCGQYRGREIK